MVSDKQTIILNGTSLLGQFLQEEQICFPNIPIAISSIVQAMAKGSKFINDNIIQSMSDKDTGYTENFNASGDVQQKLDITAHNFFLETLEETQQVCAVLSEEAEEMVLLSNKMANYIVVLDPLDGSSNIGVNSPIGTLFSIYKRNTIPEILLKESDVLFPGKQQIAAGYILYSTVTMLVYATAYGVHGFTYDPNIDEFFLTHPTIRMPENGTTYAINYGYLNHFPHYVQNYISYCKRQELSSRYSGALVADFHRHLLQGGIYLYPPTYKRPEGKLRLMLECSVLGFIAEQAGGMATDGKQPILDIVPRFMHQCVPFYIGSKAMVKTLLSFIQ